MTPLVSEISWNIERVKEVFSFIYNSETAFLFTKVEFWIFLVPLLVVFLLLEATILVRLAVTGGIALLTSWFFKNGDFIVAGLLAFIIYNGVQQFLIQVGKKKWLALLVLIISLGLGCFYFWFKLSIDRIHFNIEPIDVWLLILLILFLLSYFKKQMWVRSFFLSIVSFYFYFKSAEKLVFLLFGSVIINYFLALLIERKRDIPSGKWMLGVAVALNVILLGYFKYAYFFADSFNTLAGTDFHPTNIFAAFGNWIYGDKTFIDKILLPVGVSFFTFQSISYLVDVYRKEIDALRSLYHYAFYVTFFPPLVAGPIVRAKDFIPQIFLPYNLTKTDFSAATIMIVSGLLKKVVLADYIAMHFIDKIVDAPQAYPGFVSVIAMWGYSLQIYGDFSGYTDIAIGISLLMGFRLLQNFNSPYKATSVADFWRRWHISLGSWFREYLYIPLGGNRSGGIGTFIMTIFILIFMVFITKWYSLLYIYLGLTIVYLLVAKYIPESKKHIFRDLNLLITQVTGGLWHGASTNFVIWGFMNAIALIVYNHWRTISPYESSTKWYARAWKIFFTFNFITFTRIWFRLDEEGAPMNMVNHIWKKFDFSWETFLLVCDTYKESLLIMVAGILIHWLPSKWKDFYKNTFTKLPVVFQMIAVAFIIVLMYQAMTGESKPFVYFQF